MARRAWRPFKSTCSAIVALRPPRRHEVVFDEQTSSSTSIEFGQESPAAVGQEKPAAVPAVP